MNLLSALAASTRDPDVPLLPELMRGVRIGVDQLLPPSPAWVQVPLAAPNPAALKVCDSAWRSALETPTWLTPLSRRRFVQEVPDCLSGLTDFPHVAVGKLGIAFSEGRPPRLVCDSSVS